jgi:hypothetical protein
MFVDTRRVLERDFEQVLPAFVGRPGPWLPDLVKDALEHGYEARARLGLGFLAKKVVVRIGDPSVSQKHLVAPLRVMATGPEGLFPHLDANLEISSLVPGSVVIRLVGTYRPPLGRTGEVLDKVVLHKVAEATLDNFLDEIVSRLEHPTFLASVAR